MKCLWRSLLFVAAVVPWLGLQSVHANTISNVYFSETPQSALVTVGTANNARTTVPNPPGQTENTVPSLTMNVGDTKSLYIWYNPADLIVDPETEESLNEEKVTALALDVISNVPGLQAVSASMFASGTPAANKRFDSAGIAPAPDGGLNTDPTTLVSNLRGFTVGGRGMGNGDGVYVLDRARDNLTGSFYVGEVTFSALDPGTYGLYFRNGKFTSAAIDPNGDAIPPLFRYGDDAGPVHDATTIGVTDPIDATNSLADAYVTVLGGPTRTDLIILNRSDSPSPVLPNGEVAGPNGGVPKNIAVGGRADGTIVVENWTTSFFDVFFDVNIAPDSNTDLAGLMQTLRTQLGVDVLPSPLSDELGFGVDYDFHVVIPAVPGETQRLDFDFSANGITGVTVDNIGVPEPSSMILAAIGGVALIGFRLRRRAA